MWYEDRLSAEKAGELVREDTDSKDRLNPDGKFPVQSSTLTTRTYRQRIQIR
jgi:hypothetical protein